MKWLLLARSFQPTGPQIGICFFSLLSLYFKILAESFSSSLGPSSELPLFLSYLCVCFPALILCFVFWVRFLLCISGWAGTLYSDQAGPELLEICFCLPSARIKDLPFNLGLKCPPKRHNFLVEQINFFFWSWMIVSYHVDDENQTWGLCKNNKCSFLTSEPSQ